MGNLAETSWFQEQIENEEEEFAFTGEYDHSIDVVDPDEPELPGPDPETYGYNDPIRLTGNMVELEDLVDQTVGEPEYLGGR